MSQNIAISIKVPPVPVTPGGQLEITVTVQNRGTVVDQIVFRTQGVPKEWLSFSSPQLSLFPGDQDSVTITVKPPRSSASTAGKHTLSIWALSKEHAGEYDAVQAVFELLPFAGTTLDISPKRVASGGAGQFNVTLANSGNAAAALALTAEDDEHALDYRFEPAQFTLAPGQTANVRLTVSPRVRRTIGLGKTYSVRVTARPAAAGQGQEAVTAAQFVANPPIPPWLPPVLAGCLILACVAVAILFFAVFAQPRTPVINSFVADPAEVAPGGTVNLRWEVSDADAINLEPSVGGELALPRGSVVVNPTGNTTYKLIARNRGLLRGLLGERTVEQTVAIAILGQPPVIESFTAQPAIIIKGQVSEVTLTWVTVGADSVAITGVSGAQPTTGSSAIPAPESDTTYTLTATNASGSVDATVQVSVTGADCRVTGVTAPDHLNVRDGPGEAYPVKDQANPDEALNPVARNDDGGWIEVFTSKGIKGWVKKQYITCTNVDTTALPVEANIPTPPTSTPTPTATLANTPTPTRTPVFAGGVITYKKSEGGGISLYVVASDGTRSPLVTGVTDAEVLDFNPLRQRFAVWVKQGTTESVFVVNLGGGSVALNASWQTVTDADIGPGGARIIVQAKGADNQTRYYFFDAQGNLINIMGNAPPPVITIPVIITIRPLPIVTLHP